jgi:hypothetical protein
LDCERFVDFCELVLTEIIDNKEEDEQDDDDDGSRISDQPSGTYRSFDDISLLSEQPNGIHGESYDDEGVGNEDSEDISHRERQTGGEVVERTRYTGAPHPRQWDVPVHEHGDKFRSLNAMGHPHRKGRGAQLCHLEQPPPRRDRSSHLDDETVGTFTSYSYKNAPEQPPPRRERSRNEVEQPPPRGHYQPPSREENWVTNMCIIQ